MILSEKFKSILSQAEETATSVESLTKALSFVNFLLTCGFTQKL